MNESLDPEEVEGIMRRIKEGAVEIVERHGGIVNQFVGDEVLALYGIADAHEDDPLRAVRSAIELHDRPYSLWRKMRRHGHLDDAGFERMLGRVPDTELLLCFVELDGSTEGKKAEPVTWFRDELQRRGVGQAAT